MHKSYGYTYGYGYDMKDILVYKNVLSSDVPGNQGVDHTFSQSSAKKG